MAVEELKEVTIGILGVSCLLCEVYDLLMSHGIALQGAFVEHEKALQRLRLKRRISVLQVRTREELDRCDALIIPGGGALYAALRLHRLTAFCTPPNRVDHDRPTCSARGSTRTPSRFQDEEACVGDVRGGHLTVPGGREYEEGRAGGAGWDVDHHC